MVDHVDTMISIPPKYAVSQVTGYIKGKAQLIWPASTASGGADYVGQHFWARGYFVSTIGRDEGVIRDYIKNQEKRIKGLSR